MQKNDYSLLATPLRSSGRIYKEKTSKFRSYYQRDRDRIIHSTAFRRLKHKTQVFVNTSSDHFRTRITHSMEVSQIARTLGKIFKLNDELCETLSLAHDLGHPPFGHAGEKELNNCMKNFGGFDHNIQTLRIVTILEKKYYKFNGLNLTLETLDGLIKHNGPILNNQKYKNILGKNIFKNKIDFVKGPSLEAQLSSISDDIAYNSHDLEDGLNAGFFNFKELNDIPIISDIVKIHLRRLKKNNKELIYRQITRDLINKMVSDVVLTTNLNIKKEKIKSINDVYKTKIKLVNFSKEMRLFDKKIKFFLNKNMYNNPTVLKKTKEGSIIVSSLFKKIREKPRIYIKNNDQKMFTIERRICDFIAGMTDRYAINLYKSIK
tara:strand:+ start:3193 stop:4323 length:1131 start_codon:yes stop_codon:yes gene_type:complete